MTFALDYAIISVTHNDYPKNILKDRHCSGCASLQYMMMMDQDVFGAGKKPK